MNKIYHKSLHDWAIPVNQTDGVHSFTMHIALSEMTEVITNLLKQFKKYSGKYSMHIEFTEPNQDPKFVVGHFGCVITVLAETKEYAKLINLAVQ